MLKKLVFFHLHLQSPHPFLISKKTHRCLREKYHFIDWNNRVMMIRDQQKKAKESKASTPEYVAHPEQQLDQIKLEIDHIFGPGTAI